MFKTLKVICSPTVPGYPGYSCSRHKNTTCKMPFRRRVVEIVEVSRSWNFYPAAATLRACEPTVTRRDRRGELPVGEAMR
eukprot:381275-Rhodomonas_salina.1